MAYMRGTYYIYRGEQLEISTPNGSLSLPMDIFDDLVSMRTAQLEAEKLDKKVALRAIRRWTGNLGCVELCKKYNKKTGFETFDKLVKKRGGEKI